MLQSFNKLFHSQPRHHAESNRSYLRFYMVKKFQSRLVRNGTKQFLFFHCTKMEFFIKDFFSKCDQICGNLQIWSYLLRISLMENFVFCEVFSLEKVSCLSSYLLLPHKKSDAYLTDSQYSTQLLKKYSSLQHLSHSGHLL